MTEPTRTDGQTGATGDAPTQRFTNPPAHDELLNREPGRAADAASSEPQAPTGTDRVTAIPPETPVASVPVGPVSSGGRNNGRRWGIALLVTAAVLGVTAAGLLLLSGGTPTSALVSHVPPESFGYLEIRLDAPGDQRQNVANVLSKFPGFADQANLGLKIDEALDQLLARGGPEAGTFSRDIRPWLGDSIAVVATRLPSPTDMNAASPAGMWLVGVKDPAAAGNWVRTYLARGAPTTVYGGVELSRVDAGDGEMLVGVVGDVMVGGDEDSVQAAIDTRGASTFADSATFKEAIEAIPGDRLAFGYLDTRRVIVGMLADAAETPQPSGPLSLDALPPWIAVVIRAESDALTATLAIPAGNLSPTSANRSSTLAPHLPPTTLAAVELHDLGDLVLAGFNAFRESPEGQQSAEQIDQALRALGGAESLVGWIGDGTVALVAEGTGAPHAGLLIRAKDAEQASDRLVQLRNIVSLVGGASGVTIREEPHGAAMITIYDVGPSSVLGDVAQLPIAVAERLEIAVAQREDLVVVGFGSPFVRSVLDTEADTSLAAEERFRVALDRAGASNAGHLYLDVQRLLGQVVTRMAPDQQEFYRREVAPYLAPVQAFAASASTGDQSRARFVITVR